MTKEIDQKEPYSSSRNEALIEGAKESSMDAVAIPKSTKTFSSGRLKLNHFTEQPHWLRDNHYLHNNHRAPTESYIMCLKSCFALHTETMNIW